MLSLCSSVRSLHAAGAAQPTRCNEAKTSVRDRSCIPDKMIVSFLPRSDRAFLDSFRSFWQGEGETLAVTQSKVWTVPAIHAKVFVEGLRKLGGKVLDSHRIGITSSADMRDMAAAQTRWSGMPAVRRASSAWES